MKATKVVSSVAFNYIGTIVAAGVGFLTTPIVLHALGPANYGAWAIVSSTITYAALLDLGVGLTVMRLVAERAHLADRVPLRRVASTGLVFYTALGVAVALAGVTAAPALTRAFHLAGPEASNFETAFRIIVLAMGLTFPAGLYTGLNQGMGRFRQQNTIVIFQALSTAGAAILIVRLGGSLIALALGVAACNVAAFLVKMVYAAWSYEVYPDPRLISKAVAREVLAVSGWVFVANITNRIVWDADAIVLGAVLGPIAVAHYVVALGPATAVRRLTEQFNTVSLTAASSLRAQQDESNLRILLSEGTRVSIAVALPVLAVFAVWSEDFLALWVGPDFRTSGIVLVVLLLAISFAAIQSTAVMTLMAFNEQKKVALVSLAEASANLVLSVVLARDMGILGVAVGTATPIVLTTLLFYLPQAATKVRYRVGRIFVGLFPVVVINVVGFLLLSLVPRPMFSSLILLGACAASAVVVLAVLGVLSDPERRPVYLGMVSALWSRSARDSEKLGDGAV